MRDRISSQYMYMVIAFSLFSLYKVIMLNIWLWNGVFLYRPRFVHGTYSEGKKSIPHELARLKSPNAQCCLSATIWCDLPVHLNFLDHPGPCKLMNTAYSYVRNCNIIKDRLKWRKKTLSKRLYPIFVMPLKHIHVCLDMPMSTSI